MADSFLEACIPPWVAFPFIQPDELPRHLKQGIAEPWFDRHWRPFWKALSEEQKGQYLDHWKASPEWRETIAFTFGTLYELDAESDVPETARYDALKAEDGIAQPKRSMWSRLWRR